MTKGKKRALEDADPDYDDYMDVATQENKRQKLIEQSGKEASIKKITDIIHRQFDEQEDMMGNVISDIDEQVHECRQMMERLRGWVVTGYYQQGTEPSGEVPVIHPSVKQHLGKAPRDIPQSSTVTTATEATTQQADAGKQSQPETDVQDALTKVGTSPKRGARYKSRKTIVVGNISRFIPPEKRDENDEATHKWMVYVRGPKHEPDISEFVSKVWFFLHPSYRPNDLVEITSQPFHLTRRGWGEFPIRVQLYFHDGRNKKVDIIHSIKLDRTYTGLQTVGAETVVEIELERENVDSVPAPVTTNTTISHKPGDRRASEAMPETSTSQEKTKENTTAEPVTKATESAAKALETVAKATTQVKKTQIQITSDTAEKTGVSSLASLGTSKNLAESSGNIHKVQEAPQKSPDTPKASSSRPPKPTTPTVSTSLILPNVSPEKSVFVKCVDGSGKMFLIPQEMLVKQDRSKLVPAKPSPTPAQEKKPQAMTFILSSGGATTSTATVSSSSPSVFTPQVLGKLIQQQQQKAVQQKGAANQPILIAAPSQQQKGLQGKQTTNPQQILIAAPSIGSPQQKGSPQQGKVATNQQQILIPVSISPQQQKSSSTRTSTPQLLIASSSLGSAPTLTSLVPQRLQQPHALSPQLLMAAPTIKAGLAAARPVGPGAVSIVAGQGARKPLPVVAGGATQLLVRAQSGQMQVLQLLPSSPSQLVTPRASTAALAKGRIVQGVASSSSSVMSSLGSSSGVAVSSSLLVPAAVTSAQQQQPRSGTSSPVSLLLQPGVKKTTLATTPTATPTPTPTLSLSRGTAVSLLRSPLNMGGKKHISLLTGKTLISNVDKTGPPTIIPPTPAALTPTVEGSEVGVAEKRVICGGKAGGSTAARNSMQQQRMPTPPRDIACSFENIEAIVRYVVAFHPLVGDSHTDRSVHPYCAPSVETYLSWNVGKRRACELGRAGAMRRDMERIVERGAAASEDGGGALGEMWSRRDIVLWCRYHCYTPLDHEILSRLHKAPSSLSWFADYTSVSEPPPLFLDIPAPSSHSTDISHRDDDDDEEVIDVEEEDIVNTAPHNSPYKQQAVDERRETLPPSSQAHFVATQAKQIGVELGASEVAPGVDGHVSAQIIWAVYERLLEDILRKSCAVVHQTSTVPEEISANEVYRALMGISVCDFLTNKGLGVKPRCSTIQDVEK